MEIERGRKFWAAVILVNAAIAGWIVWMCLMRVDYSAEQKRDSHLIGMSYMTMNNEFYKIIREEINARIEAEGDRMVLRDPALDADRQAEQIGEMLDMGIEVLVLTPVDGQKIAPVLRRAKEMGVRIVVVDSDVEDDGLADCTITSDNYEAGVIVGKYLLQRHARARIVVMTHEAAKSGRDRVQGFIDAVSGCGGIEIVEKIECEGQTELAMPAMQEAIAQGIEFDSVFCLNDLAGVGVVAALEDSGLSETTGVYGVDASPDAKALIKEGLMEASAAQFPSEMGEEAARVIYRLLDGELVEKQIFMPVELVTKENVEEFGISRWQ